MPVAFPEPVADRYCNDVPANVMAAAVGLYNSTNLWVYGWLAEPPRP